MHDWIGRIKSGDNEVLKEIYIEQREPFFAFIRKSFSNIQPEDLKELFQVSVVIMYDNIIKEKLTEATSAVKTYLFAIGRNKALELIKSRKGIEGGARDMLLDHIVNDVEEGDAKRALENDILKMNDAIEELGDPCKSIIQSFYYRQWSMDKISKLLGYSNSATAKNLKYKCIKRLQRIFQNTKLKVSVQ